MNNRSISMVGLSDNQLMELVAESDRAAFTELYSRWAGRIRYFFLRLYSFNGYMADDRTQDTFLKVLEKASGFDNTQRFSPWLYSIAYNLFKNDLRRQQLENTFRNSIKNVPAGEMPQTERLFDLKQSTEFINKALDILGDETKTIFVLRHAEELSIPEIARITGLPEGTVKSRLFYAMKKLSENLQTHQLSEWI